MTVTLPQSGASLSIGRVKWFGGENHKTGRESDFGFITSIEGDDIFVHRSQIAGPAPDEGDFAVFAVQVENGKKRAQGVSLCRDIETFETAALATYLRGPQALERMLADFTYRDLLLSLINRRDNDWVMPLLTALLPGSAAARRVVGMLRDQARQTRLLDGIGLAGLAALDDGFRHVPASYFDARHGEWIAWLKAGSTADRTRFFASKIGELPFSFVLACVFEGVIDRPETLGPQRERLALFAKQTVQKRLEGRAPAEAGDEPLDYVRALYRRRFRGFDDFTANPALAPFFEKLRVKQKIANRDRSFVDDVAQSAWLRHDPECFVLSRFLPLVWDGNSDPSLEAVFFHQLWEALLAGSLSLDDPGFKAVFPSCRTLGPALSCEARYWEKGGKHYCRGRECKDPQNIPDLEKSPFDYTLYDWLSYFGRDYAQAPQPERRDFPVKLAGYLNRLIEVSARLACRCCGKIMKPDFRYSRVEVRVHDPETDRIVTRPFSAAYRCTVFYCAMPGCAEVGRKHYLNHCLGKDCGAIVDSRDLSQCSNGYYRCTCGSCCPEHAVEAEQRRAAMVQKAGARSQRRR